MQRTYLAHQNNGEVTITYEYGLLLKIVSLNIDIGIEIIG